MRIVANTMTDAQMAAAETLRLDKGERLNLTLDMPRINGADAYVTGKPIWSDDPYLTREWIIAADGTTTERMEW